MIYEPTREWKPRKAAIKKLLGDTTGMSILDAGCGKYPVSDGLKGNITKIDIMEDVADMKVDLNHPIPLESSSFDLVIAGEVVEHLQRPKVFLHECHRVLKKNGRFLMTVPNICCLKNRALVLFGKFPLSAAKADLKPGWDDHHSDYNIDFLQIVLKEAGFKIQTIVTNGVFIGRKKIPLLSSHVSFGESLIVLCRKRAKS